MARVIGLTGNIACGKTTIGRILIDLGAERYIDADALVHRLYKAGQTVALQVAQTFGSRVLAEDGSIDRKKLGSIVFHNASALQQLEQIVHPAVGIAVLAELQMVSATGVAVLDAVKLLEGQSGALCQSKWLVVCSHEQELERLMARNHMSYEEALARLQAQPDSAQKRKLVDEVSDNSGTPDETRRQVIAAWQRFSLQFPAL